MIKMKVKVKDKVKIKVKVKIKGISNYPTKAVSKSLKQKVNKHRKSNFNSKKI